MSLICAAFVYCVYGQVINHTFLLWDDIPFYIYNEHLHSFSPSNLIWIFTSSGDGIWKPLTWLTFMLEFRWIDSANGPHLLINPAIHALNAMLVGSLVFNLLSLSALSAILPLQIQRYVAGLMATVIFAVHPLNVEAATWLSGRKEVLCAFFYLASVLLWVQRLRQPDRQQALLTLAWLMQLLAVMSKAMAVTIPVVLVLLDIVARRPEPIWRLTLEKWPFWLLSATMVPVGIWAQLAVHALPGIDKVGPLLRYAQGIESYPAFMAKFLLPLNLVPYYPSRLEVNVQQTSIYSVAVLLLLALAWTDYRSGSRAWFLVILWYLAVFFPVTGWLQVGIHRAADRYTYLPVVSLCSASAVLLVRGLWRRPAVLAFVCALLAVTLTSLAHQQVGVWKDDRTLWEYTASHETPSALIMNNLGAARFADGDFQAAKKAYMLAVQLTPDPAYYENLRVACIRSEDWVCARETSIRIRSIVQEKPDKTTP